jgi:hypothetical protein
MSKLVLTPRATVLGDTVPAVGRVNGHDSCIERNGAVFGVPIVLSTGLANPSITLSPIGIVSPVVPKVPITLANEVPDRDE